MPRWRTAAARSPTGSASGRIRSSSPRRRPGAAPRRERSDLRRRRADRGGAWGPTGPVGRCSRAIPTACGPSTGPSGWSSCSCPRRSAGAARTAVRRSGWRKPSPRAAARRGLGGRARRSPRRTRRSRRGRYPSRRPDHHRGADGELRAVDRSPGVAADEVGADDPVEVDGDLPVHLWWSLGGLQRTASHARPRGGGPGVGAPRCRWRPGRGGRRGATRARRRS